MSSQAGSWSLGSSINHLYWVFQMLAASQYCEKLKQQEQNSSAVLHNFLAATGKSMWNVSLCLCDRFNCKRTVEIAMGNDNQRVSNATTGISSGTRARCLGRGTEATDLRAAGEGVCVPGRKENPAGFRQLWEWVDNKVYMKSGGGGENPHGFLEAYGPLIKVWLF